MKILQCITLIALGSAAWTLSSCCSKDKNCVAANASVATFPYKQGQELAFADTAGNTVSMRLADNLILSPAYTVDGSCNAMKKENDCHLSAELRSQAITDTAGVVPPGQRLFQCMIDQTTGETYKSPVTLYSLSLFGAPVVMITQYGSDNTVSGSVQIPAYTTPYRTYSGVYTNQPERNPRAPAYLKKFVFTNEGRLLSFSVGQDTSHIFYLVE